MRNESQPSACHQTGQVRGDLGTHWIWVGLVADSSFAGLSVYFPPLRRPTHLPAWGDGLHCSCMQEFPTLMGAGSQRAPGGALCSVQRTLPGALIAFQGRGGPF